MHAADPCDRLKDNSLDPDFQWRGISLPQPLHIGTTEQEIGISTVGLFVVINGPKGSVV